MDVSAAGATATVSEQALVYEEELARNPFSLRDWWSYISSHVGSEARPARLVLYERALVHLPGSYKLWHALLREAVLLVRVPWRPQSGSSSFSGGGLHCGAVAALRYSRLCAR